jgi:hypothetical protein
MVVVTRGIIAVLYEHGRTQIVTLDDGSEWRLLRAGRPPRVGAEAEVVRLGCNHELRTGGHAMVVEPARPAKAPGL